MTRARPEPMAFRKILFPGKTQTFARLAAGYIKLLGQTALLTVRDDPAFPAVLSSGRNIIFAFWHNQLIFMPGVYSRRFKNRRMAVIVSQSRDGELIGGVIEKFGLRPIRGSSSRGGRGALLNLLRSLRQGWDVAVTPDGPRGPRYRVQEGIVGLASSSGAPIVAVSSHSSWKLVFRRSWDQLRLPLPGGRINVAFSSPLWVPPKLGGSDRARFCRELEDKLHETGRLAARGVI